MFTQNRVTFLTAEDVYSAVETPPEATFGFLFQQYSYSVKQFEKMCQNRVSIMKQDRRIHCTETRVRSEVSSCGIRGREGGIGTFSVF